VAETKRGLLLGTAAYLLWGVFPLYFPLLEPAGPVEILSHRIVWSALIMALLVLVLHRRAQFRALVRDKRTFGLLCVAAITITSNWLTYIYAVNNDRVVEASLGYFINPLVTVLLGVVVLHEGLRLAQWAALTVGIVAVLILTWDYGHPPWLSLILAFSFGTYGLAKKAANAGAVETLALETLLLTPIALAYLTYLQTQGDSTFVNEGWGHAVLLVTTGLVTAVPLILFGAAAVRMPLVTLGLLQYLAPILQFLIGVLIVGEHMTQGRWIGFALVWIALVVFTAESLRHRRRQLVLAAESSTAA